VAVSSRRERAQDTELDALYAELPRMECKGLCAARCETTLTMSTRERSRLKEHHVGEENNCPMFKDGRCKAYEIRPTFCRLWGMTEDMRCPYGCEPSRVLTAKEGAGFLHRADEIGGKGRHGWEILGLA
jgi:Fe-S-cluster containining protein